MGCHDNHAFSHSPHQFIYELFYFAFKGSQVTIWRQFKIVNGVQGSLIRFLGSWFKK